MVELHLPVMEKEVLGYLNCRDEGIYVDATVGDGGHAEAICRSLAPGGKLIGLDWDDAALKRAEERLSAFSGQVSLVHADYTRLEEVLKEKGFSRVNGILIDLGASTLQLMDAERGFSLHREGGLDMRMDRRQTVTAREIVNNYSVEKLADIFFRYGEERWARRIAARIKHEKEQTGPITGSSRLAEIVKEAIPARYRRRGGHPSRKVFQALRIVVNRELDNIAEVLPQAVKCLMPGGRLTLIAYHSLEDRLVKNFFREWARRCTCPPDRPCICKGEAEITILTAKAVRPGEDEVNRNPRSRSARLRAAERLETTGRKEGE